MSVFKKGFLSAWKANEACITHFKVTAMRGFLLEVKDQDHHSPKSSIPGLSGRPETFLGYFASSVGS